MTPLLPASLTGVAVRFQPDSRLVALAREGHDRAFEEIVRRYREPLVSFARGIVGHHRAEDVVQEALTRAHGAMLAGDAEIKARPWLYAIVRNGALNALRDEPDCEPLDDAFDGVPQPPEIAARREELAALTAQLKALPPAQRGALVKREFEGRSHEEIAESLGVTPGAVRGLIFRARCTLRDSAGMLIPMPLLRALLTSAPSSSDAAATGVGGAAAGLVAGGGGIAVKAGTTLGIAVIAVGSGFAIQHRGSNSDPKSGSLAGRSHSVSAAHPRGAPDALRAGIASRQGSIAGSEDGSGSGHEGDRGGSGGGSSSGPGSGGDSGTGSGGAGPSADSGTGDGGGSGTSDGGDGGSSGGDGGGSSGDGGGTTSTSDGGGDSGTSGDGGGDLITTTTTTPTPTTTTTTTSDGGGSGTSGDDGGTSGPGD